MSAIVTYTDILPVDRAAAQWLSRKLAAHRRAIGTRKGTRRLTPWAHAIYTLRFLIDGTRIKQLAASNALLFTLPSAERERHFHTTAAAEPLEFPVASAITAHAGAHPSGQHWRLIGSGRRLTLAELAHRAETT